MTTLTEPLGKQLTDEKVTREQKIAIFFSNKPLTDIEEHEQQILTCHLLID